MIGAHDVVRRGRFKLAAQRLPEGKSDFIGCALEVSNQASYFACSNTVQ
jgi:hypothetical protein